MLGNDAYATHFAQWADMFESDMTRICEEFRGQLIIIRNYFDTASPDLTILTITEKIDNHLNYMMRAHLLNRRHLMLIRFINKLIALYGENNFRNKKEIFYFCKEAQVQEVLENTGISFKLLFGFYKINDSAYIGYAKNELGEHIKLTKTPNQNSWQLAIVKNIQFELSKTQFSIIRNQDFLANFEKFDDGSEIKIAKFLCDIVEMEVFGKKRDLLPTLDSFYCTERSNEKQLIPPEVIA